MKKKKVFLLQVFRQIQGYTLKKIAKNIGSSPITLCNYETGKYIPPRKALKKIAKGFNIYPDILFYSFGYFGDTEIEIIKSDPFYYMEKIKELCHNHSNRYKEENINIEELNRIRAFEYFQKYRRNNNDK